ncbi:thiamine-phosphate kinase [Methanobrevibacter sp. OttesenSCG-928-K11]|nr:thiamine-phosphate kinase [Methanobrevibacter sp. OttesenSCG-928-K11]MDL2270376.1 thiamine-phosphate kinase [Methanobrevibacter sp. OttesenSCG-928-I08]
MEDITELKVSDFGERFLIKIIINKTKKSQNTPFILGDDASAIPIHKNQDLIASSDMLIQSKHFPKEMSYFQMGFKSVTVNLSDIAAMGAKPLGFLLNIAIPKNLSIKNFNDLIDGVLDACNFYDIYLIGGDTNEANEIILSATALGLTDKNKLLTKHGFEVGDLVCTTGQIGLASLGFYLLNNISDYNESILKPIAKVREGLILNDNSASAATDITDGLGFELYELLNSDKQFSNISKGILIYEDKLNISDDYKKIAQSLNKNYLDLILYFGEDFELLFTISKSNALKLEKLMDFNIIGIVTNNSKVEIKRINGEIQEISEKGYEHLI